MILKETASIPELLFNTIIWFIVLFACRRQISEKNNHGMRYGVFAFLVTLTCTFAFNVADYWSYRSLYSTIIHTNTNQHLEDFYYWLLLLLPKEYHIWRLVVWGLSTFFLIQTFKRLQLHPPFACLMFCLLLMTYFAAPRNSLGFVVLFYGTTFLFFPSKNKLKSGLTGLLFIGCSYFLHRSMFMYIMLIAVSAIPIGKWLYITSIAIFPIIYSNVVLISTTVLSNSIANEDSQQHGEGYIESNFQEELNMNGVIRLIITRLPILILLGMAIYETALKKEIKIPAGIRIFMQYSYILIYISFLFYAQPVSAFLTTRFWDASTYSLTIFFAYYYFKHKRTTTVRYCLYGLVLANLYNIAYAFYKA